MRLPVKAIVCAAILLGSIAIAPAAKADGITIQAGGFSLTNLGHTNGGGAGLDSLVGVSTFTATNPANGDGTNLFLMNLLTFSTGFTGNGSHGSHSFTFSQPISVNGVTQTLQLTGLIDIGSSVDSVHIISSTLLTFQFSTFSVDVRVLPRDIAGFGVGVFNDKLEGEYTITTGTTVPEPATLSLLGLGLAGIAAKLRKRRKLRSRYTPGEST